jgi:hypothetical protein
MHGINPADKDTHFSLLPYRGSGGFDALLAAIAFVCDSSVVYLAVYQLKFLVVSFNNSTWFHIDYDPLLAGQVWTIMSPILLAPKSSSEIIVKYVYLSVMDS